MKRKRISQEGLKLIACLSMLIDHCGYVFAPGYHIYYCMRIIGRIAFPIYCFLLAEGAHYTGSRKRYALRLTAGMLLSEIPFDLALSGGLTLRYQSVMVTLLLGFLAICSVEKCRKWWTKTLVVIPFVILADLLMTDYGGHGVLLILLFAATREKTHKRLWQFLGMGVLCFTMGSAPVRLGSISIPIEMFALPALALIAWYNGEKRTRSPGVQWAFYLFYPVHLAVLAALSRW